ncbi:MAG: hypothetical protein GF317_16905 [Candidatus Lokiarchaeota archaeon]|nr:hypothetical protein [Candidatus Lokiarchaeota archaeon]MBD3201198.1 hypothetical protein [Candidatus Lokiarchaeota archaeon]
MTLQLSEKERVESVFQSENEFNSKLKARSFIMSKYTIPYSYFKINSNAKNKAKINNIEKLSEYSEEFKNILKREIM